MGISGRRLAFSSIALTALASGAQAHGATRKSLSFKQPLPNAEFVTNPPSIPSVASSDVHPHVVARRFLTEHIHGVSDFRIREDSYTDQNTGISHVYVRQLVNGIEVADGDVNLNIRDGQVLSYGSSVFTGDQSDVLRWPEWSQVTYCTEIPKGSDPFACDVSLDRIRAAASLYTARGKPTSPAAAAFFFTLAAYPDDLPSNVHIESASATRHQCSDAFSTDCWTVSSLPGILSPVKARLTYVQTRTPGRTHNQLNLAWHLEVEMKDNHYEAFVSAYDPTKIIASADWVKDAPAPRSDGWLSAFQAKVFGESVFGAEYPVVEAIVRLASSEEPVSAPVPSPSSPGGTYRVWKWGINDPESGNRTLEVSPYDKTASPIGWHSVPARNDPVNAHPDLSADTIVNYTTTVGNNVIAQANWQGGSDWKTNPRPDGGPDLVFDFPYGANPWEEGWQTREPRKYVNTTITQLFYMANTYHDLLYLYGFDEPSGNFQQYNFGKGGTEGDGVIVDGQDSSGFNNANYLTPPDGINGRCRMFLWNAAKPFRDGGLDAGILIHELSHGLSTRLTGGPNNARCLNTNQAGGMGEGWGDWIATTVRSTSTYSDYPIAAWAINNTAGIRHFIYSTNDTVNPSKYDFLQRLDWREVHGIGEVWAEMLWVVSNKLIEKHGFSDSLFPSSDANFYKTFVRRNGAKQLVPRKGNTLALQLVVNGMKLQPCNPTFVQARDAIIAADAALTGGENKCLLWAGFASRGLGTDAKKLGVARNPSINGFKVPPECQ